MSENHSETPPADRSRACKRLGADQWASLSRSQRLDFHRIRMLARRERQMLRVPNSRHRPSGSISGGNRNATRIGNAGAKHPPHQHSREIARRAAQAPPG